MWFFLLTVGCGDDLPEPGSFNDTAEEVDTAPEEWIDTGSSDGPVTQVTMWVQMVGPDGVLEDVGSVPVSAFSATAADLDILAYGMSESPFPVPSQAVKIFVGNPLVSGEIDHDLVTEDGYVILEMLDEQFISDPVETTLVENRSFEGDMALSMLVGHKYYDTTIDGWDLDDGDPHDPEYTRGEDWKAECDLWDVWIYQDDGHVLLPEEDSDAFVRGNWCFLQPWETLEVHGARLRLEGALSNFIQNVAVSHDDFRFDYVDVENDIYWVVNGKAW